MLLCNNDHHFRPFNAFFSVSYLYYCFASISFCMSVSLLRFNSPPKYERDLSNLWWRVFLLEKTRNSAILSLFKLCARNISSFPKIKTIKTWKKDFSWLNLSPSEGMKCKLWVKWEKNIDFWKNYSDAFVKGSKNYKKSAVSDHEKTSQHEKSKELEEKEKCETSGLPLQKKCVSGKTIII